MVHALCFIDSCRTPFVDQIHPACKEMHFMTEIFIPWMCAFRPSEMLKKLELQGVNSEKKKKHKNNEIN